MKKDDFIKIMATIHNAEKVKSLHKIIYSFEYMGVVQTGELRFLSDDLWVIPKHYCCYDDDLTKAIIERYASGDNKLSIYYSPSQKLAYCFKGLDMNWFVIHTYGIIYISAIAVSGYCFYCLL